MKIGYENKGSIAILTIRGDLSVEETDRFQREALQKMDQEIRDFVLDFAALDFIDSRGLEILIWLQDKCAELLGQVRFVACPKHIQKVLEVTRLGSRFDCHPDIDSAIQSLEHLELN